MADFVDVVVEEFVNKIDVRQEHSSAAVPGESQRVKDFADVLLFLHLFGPIAHQLAELFPLMCDDFTTTKTAYWNYHFSLLSFLFEF